MSTTTRCAQRLLLAIAVLAICIPTAWGFYPYGFFSTIQNGELVIIKWPLSAFDTNGDGDVSGQNEGLELNFETGNGVDGFTGEEVSKVLEGMSEWERVSTGYVAFRRGQDITDPVETAAGLDSIDAFNVMVFESEDDAAGGSIAGGSLAVILPANSFEDTFVTIGNQTFPVTGGQMLDVDIVFGFGVRNLEAQQTGLLQGVGVPAAGLLLGLGYSPLTNVNDEVTEEGFLVEDKVVAIRNFDNTISERGVTSSMLNEIVVYAEGGGNFFSWNDLAPTDISAITFMYPRTDLDFFFNINQRARTQANQGFASAPISGAWIRAWCDADNKAATKRVPFVDTLTGLYYNTTDTSFGGHFQLKGMFKQLETINQQTFTANYTISCSEFLPIVFPDDLRTIYDSTHGGFNGGVGAIQFDTLFPSEVFKEGGNSFGLNTVDQGTPLIFDLITRKVISQTSGKTLDVLLATGRPMFGDQDQTCPLNVIVGPVDGGVQAIAALRTMRDEALLSSAVGTAVVDLYYRVAPAAAQFFVQHATIAAAAGYLVAPVRWVVVNAEYLLAALAVFLIGTTARRRVLRVRTAAAMVLLCLLAFGVPVSHAQMLPLEISDYLAQSDDVVVGKVTEIESRWIQNNTKIITDVAIQVEDPVKGPQNKEGVVHLQLPTGRVGAIGRSSAQLPTFTVGEEVLVFLDAQKKGYMVTGGIAGKYLIAPHPKTGEKYVFATSMPGHIRLEREIAKMHQQKASDGVEFANTKGPMKIDFERRTLVKLDDFVKYLRDLDKRQEKLTVTTSKSAE